MEQTVTRLTDHFTLEEMVRSYIANAHNISNMPGKEEMINLRILCEEVLEPIRTFIGDEVIINSGYRCKELNKLVGGVENSQHIKGQAADFKVRTKEETKAVENFLYKMRIYDQAIVYGSSYDYMWFHVSYNTEGQQRYQLLYRNKSAKPE